MNKPIPRPQSREVSVVIQDFIITGDLTYDHGLACYSDIEDVYLMNKGVGMFVDDPSKLGALVDGVWMSFEQLLLREASA